MRYLPSPASARHDHSHVLHVADCAGCDRRQSWSGRLADRPRCACGYSQTDDELAADQLAIDRLLALL